MTKRTVYSTPLGNLMLETEKDRLVSLRFTGEALPGGSRTGFTDRVFGQVTEYLSGNRTRFDLPYVLTGTPFAVKVWEETARIPYGKTRTYGEIARAIGVPGAARAVGAALNRNPLWLVIPCHRVVGKGGFWQGYAGGRELKRFLMKTEGICVPGEEKSPHPEKGMRAEGTKPILS